MWHGGRRMNIFESFMGLNSGSQLRYSSFTFNELTNLAEVPHLKIIMSTLQS